MHLKYCSEIPTFCRNYLAMRNTTAEVTGGKSFAVWSQSVSGVSAINPLVAFNDIHGRKRELIFFYFGLNTTRDIKYGCNTLINIAVYKVDCTIHHHHQTVNFRLLTLRIQRRNVMYLCTSLVHRYITSRLFPFRLSRDNFLLLVTMHAQTFRFFYFDQIPHTRQFRLQGV
jgi:hypothetical protein